MGNYIDMIKIAIMLIRGLEKPKFITTPKIHLPVKGNTYFVGSVLIAEFIAFYFDQLILQQLLHESHSNSWISVFQSSCCSSLVTFCGHSIAFSHLYHFLKSTWSYYDHVNLQGSVSFTWYRLPILLLKFGSLGPCWKGVMEYFQSYMIILDQQYLSRKSQFN